MEYKEFFEKYWRVKDANGNMVPVQLSDVEWEVFDVANELNVDPYVRTYRRMHLPKYAVNPIVLDAIEKRRKLMEQ